MIFKILRRVTGRFMTLAVPLITAIAVAQAPATGSCAGLVREALQAANSACTDTTRNQICYGNVQGAVTPADGVDDLVFENVGDMAAIAQIKALQLSPLNEADNQWGVALMQLQATLPDTLPGQNVTFLMFGDVTVEDNTGTQTRVDGSVLQAANLRLSPSLTGPILGSLPDAAVIVGTGKAINSAGELWVRLRYEDYRTKTGWMLADLIDIDFAALPDVATDSLTYSPMQAFYFKTGIGQTQCADAPVNGVLVQTPEGAGKVNFNVNGIDVALGSTALLTSPDDINNTCLSLITGDADIRSAGKVLNLNPGERSCTPLNDDGTAGEPGKPEPFDMSEIASVAQVIESLPQTVEIPDPAPTRVPTQIPTAVPTAAPTDVPADVPVEQPPVQPTIAPTPEGRYVEVTQARNGGWVDFTAFGLPDEPSSYLWQFGEGSSSAQTAGFGYGAGASYNVLLTVCWSDGECIDTVVSGTIPACPISSLEPSVSITLTYDGPNSPAGYDYEVFRLKENCEWKSVGLFGQNNTNFARQANYGEAWRVVEVYPYPGWVAYEVTVYDMPVSAYVPGFSATAEVMDSNVMLVATPAGR